MTVLTIRGVPDGTLAALRAEAAQRGISINRLIVDLLDDRADLRRRRDGLRRLHDRLEAARARATAGSVDSAALLWAERGGR